MSSCVMAVSYTHLDVYKRQCLPMLVRAAALWTPLGQRTVLRNFQSVIAGMAKRAGTTSQLALKMCIRDRWSGNQSRLRLLPLQRSVAVGPVNDPLEHEAERVAEQVMRTSASQMATPPTTLPGAAARKAPGIVDRALSSPGQLLDGATRGYFEPRFGLNFDAVRVHTDDAAKHSAAAIGARAYTHGSHILFAAGERPGADRLTAHELTHVAQNASGCLLYTSHSYRNSGGAALAFRHAH